MYNPETKIITTSSIDIKRGTLRLSSHLTIGNIAEASNTAIVNGRITEEAIFKTAPAIMLQIKTIKKKTARPELKLFFTILFTFKLSHTC
jgi:hypothetical protein